MKAAEEQLAMIERFLKTGEVPPDPKKAVPAKTSAPNKVAAPTPTPAAPVQPPVVPPPTQRVDPSSAASMTPAQLAEFSRQYGVLMMRAGKARMDLINLQRTAGSSTSLPADVSNARDRVDGELQMIARSVQTHNNAQIEQNLRAAEATVTVIEQYLNRQPPR